MNPNIAILLASAYERELCNSQIRHLPCTIQPNEDLKIEEQSRFYLLDTPSSIVISAASGFYDPTQKSSVGTHQFDGGMTIENNSAVAKTIEFLVVSGDPISESVIQQLD
ncbi:hypothetical protein ACE193_15225 [Bernardetia sp. OM2101]|uniref:hypothetical protein n=1 Tax=Bernardetia sp. OM2101 TaxID=3344876 RepID=UPI0035CF74AB